MRHVARLAVCLSLIAATSSIRDRTTFTTFADGAARPLASSPFDRPTDVVIGWRVLGTDPPDVSFNLHRATGGGAPVKLNATPITGATQFVDTAADLTQANAYSVRAIIHGTRAARRIAVHPRSQRRRALVPARAAAGARRRRHACRRGLHLSPQRSQRWRSRRRRRIRAGRQVGAIQRKGQSQGGYTGNVYIDAYTIGGTRLWRIDLGRNIRAGAHYTQVMVYDLDGDGKAEVACKTADGTIDGVGTVIGDGAADWRNANGFILQGPEFLTIFNGQTGAALATASYIVPRGNAADWGDNNGNRVDRFLAAIAYLDGQRPSLVMARGYYTRAVLAAWNWRDGQLTSLWTFDTGYPAHQIHSPPGAVRAITTSASATSTATGATRSPTAPRRSMTTGRGCIQRVEDTATRCTCRISIPIVQDWRYFSRTNRRRHTARTAWNSAMRARAR